MSAASSADIMIKIPDDDLPKLAKLYEKHTSWAPHVVSLVNMGIKWKKSEKFRHLITFMSPNNSWEQDGTFVVLYTCNCYDLFIFTLDENCHNLYRGLMETKLIDFNRERLLFFAVHEKHVSIVYKFFKDKNLNLQKQTVTCLIYAISPEGGRNFTIECPDDVYVKKLDPSLAEQINNAWPHRYPNSQYYLSDMIEINGGYGVFLKSNNELIAWVLKHCFGHLGMLQTEEKYKKKGYGTLITKVLSKEIGEDGHWPLGTIVEGNQASINMFEKLGFRYFGTCTFIVVDMFKVVFLLVLTSANTFHAFIFKPGPLIPASKGEVWPKPQNENKLDDGYFSLLPSFFSFKSVGNNCNTLNDALIRYKNIILFKSRRIKSIYFKVRTCYEGSDPNFLGFLTSLDVELTGFCDDNEFPSLEMKEEYILNITSKVQKLTSETVWGILRGLETFSQLIYLTDDFSCHRVDTTSIHDYPRFAHRGLLLDTSRHYHTEGNILKLLDAMSYNKMNVFHWHITDDYSFPYASLNFPELSEKGAFHPSLMIYDQQFINDMQEYARKRGIRVMVEFDTPGHTLSWGLGNPDLLTACYNVPRLEWGPIDPTKNTTYTFIFKLFDEIKSVFKDKYIHLGGDEVDFSCWRSNPDVNRFMLENGMEGDYVALQSFYIQKLINYVESLGLKSIVWEEVFTNGVVLPKTTVINVWKSDDPRGTLNNVTKSGYPAIISSYWYLDILQTGGDWLKFYNADPRDFDGTDEQKQLVFGAEACMWSEVVDENNLESRVWPRASVAAEKFWSAPDSKKTDMMELWPIASRLQEQTCRMNRRGIHAQPPTGPSVCF